MRKKRQRQYEVCPNCGAHLDHGEKCDCGRAMGKEAAHGDGMCKRGAGV